MASDIPLTSTKLQLQLTDVYVIAEKVGEQFEQLIKQFGSVHMGTVIPMVISSLEHLEQFVEDHQRLEISNRKLLLQVDSLAQEREQRIKLSDTVDVSYVQAAHKQAAVGEGRGYQYCQSQCH